MRRILFSTLLVLGGLFIFVPALVLAQSEDSVDSTVEIVDEMADIVIDEAPMETKESDAFEGVAMKDVFIADNSVTVSAPVNGDLWAAGNSVTVNAEIANDVLAAGQTITINGTVHGDVRAAGNSVIINGTVLGNVTAAGANIIINSDSHVDGNVLAYAGSVTQLGTVAGNVSGGAGAIEFGEGSLTLGNVEIETDDLTLEEGARINGNLTYSSPQEAEYPSGVVGGNVDYTLTVTEERATNTSGFNGLPNIDFSPEFTLNPGTWSFMNFLSFLSRIVFWILIGLLLWYTTPKLLKDVENVIKAETGPAFGWGLLWSIAIPIIAVILIFTLIGIPVSILLFISLAIAMLLAKLMVGYVLGNLVWKKQKEGQGIWAFFVGIGLLALAMALPFGLGWLIGTVANIFGFGGLLMVLYRRRQARKGKK